MDEDRGRPRVLARARRAHQRQLPRLLDRRGVLPRDAHPRDLGRGRPALPQGEGRRRGRLPHHPALLRQLALLRLRRPRPRDRHRGPDRARHPADHDLQPALARDEHVRCDDPRPRPHRPAPAPGERRGGGRVRGGLRDHAVRRPAGQRRARDPLLHAQPLTGDARDPQHAAPVAPLGSRAHRPGRRRSAWRRPPSAARCRASRPPPPSRRRAGSARRRCRPGDRCRRPRRPGTSASR